MLQKEQMVWKLSSSCSTAPILKFLPSTFSDESFSLVFVSLPLSLTNHIPECEYITYFGRKIKAAGIHCYVVRPRHKCRNSTVASNRERDKHQQ
jgi:hypothetical protein